MGLYIYINLITSNKLDYLMIKIALVDDDKNILVSLKMILESEGYTIHTYPDGIAALKGIKNNSVDIILLDIKMPRMNGMELFRKLREFNNVPVIFLTSKDDELDEIFGFKMGADDYIRKPFSQKVLLERIKAVLRRVDFNKTFKPSLEEDGTIQCGSLVLSSKLHTCLWEGNNISLTSTEFLLMRSLLNRPGVVKSRDQLMDEAYKENVYLDDRTIDSHIKRIRKKFKLLNSDFTAIETIYGVGYKIKIDEQ